MVHHRDEGVDNVHYEVEVKDMGDDCSIVSVESIASFVLQFELFPKFVEGQKEVLVAIESPSHSEIK